MNRKNIFFITIITLITIGGFVACEERDYYENSNATLNFSMDTVSFDTVFTTIGSATMHFTVRNPYDQDLEINSISLLGGASSNFRINIDGSPELSAENKLLRAQDSMYIFVDVTVDPSIQNLAFLIEDNIVFNTNGKEQKVLLQAYGQDAHHIKLGEWGDAAMQVQEYTDGSLDTTYFVLLNNDTTLKADKPYYLHHSFAVNEGVKLTLDPGVKFYIEKDKSIYVLGSLSSNGTVEKPVEFRGHRMDNMFPDTPYDKVPGQWGVLAFQSQSYDNHLKHTHIRNGLIGLYVDSLSVNDKPKVKLENCRIENMTSAAIYSLYGEIEAENSLFANCEQYVFGASAGGKYSFTNCTFGNHYSWAGHSDPSVVLTNYYIYNNDVIPFPLIQADFTNCIIWGTANSELSLSDKDEDGNLIEADFNFSFDHCLIKADIKEDIDTNDVRFSDVIWNYDPLFREPKEEWDFHPDTLSPVIDMGIPTHLNADINERPYINAPEIGAFEYAGTLDEE